MAAGFRSARKMVLLSIDQVIFAIAEPLKNRLNGTSRTATHVSKQKKIAFLVFSFQSAM